MGERTLLGNMFQAMPCLILYHLGGAVRSSVVAAKCTPCDSLWSLNFLWFVTRLEF